MRIRMGLNHDGSARVTAGGSEYRVERREEKHEYLPSDYTVTLVRGLDVLEDDQVRRCAHDARISMRRGLCDGVV